MREVYFGLDVGTSSTKAVLVDRDGTVVAQAVPAIFEAAITACVRLSTSSLVRIAETWAFTVASETPSS